MSTRSEEIRRILDHEDEEFRRWSQQHHEFEERLAQLSTKPTLTPEEEVEEKQLKKRKLFLKDQMAARIRSYEESQSAHA